ncbi:endonuclease/exonuclease/phosphatase family protein [Candidatus Sumerlaeota bacterium]|nr:endonuclease/exonuclease/phosphatase family protein [Candidatus Sumerlaeota bacterium]
MIRNATHFLITLMFCIAAAAPMRAEEARGQTTVVVMTYNVLCSFCDRANYDPWEERLHYFRDIITRHKPDLMGLQELSKAEEVRQIADLNPEFEFLFYDESGGEKPRAYPDETIAWRKDRFELMEKGWYWLGPTPDTAWSKGWSKVQFWRLAGWARLREKSSGREFYFTNTHFDNNKPNQEMSAPLVLSRIAPWAEKMPCIMAGDFNSKPDSPAYATLTRGVDGKGFKLTNAFDLAPKWEADANQTPAPQYDPAERIDHIFVAGKAEFHTMRWVVDLHVYGGQNRYPSDHKAIITEIRF